MEPDSTPQDGANTIETRAVRPRPGPSPPWRLGRGCRPGSDGPLGACRSSATYDEVAYLRVAADWWRTGDAGSRSPGWARR